MPALLGIYCPIVTPFTTNLDQINFQALEENLNWLEKTCISGLVPLGTAGEFPSLQESEKIELVEAVAEKTKLPVIVGATYNNLADTLNFLNAVEIYKPTAALIATPYFLKLDVESVKNYFLTLANRTSIPIILYNFPQLTKNFLHPQTVAVLAKHPMIIGLKDTSGDMESFREMAILTAEEDFSLLCGHDSFLSECLEYGASGGILCSANFLPELAFSILESYKTKPEKANQEQAKLANLTELIFSTGVFPAAVKYAMDYLNLRGGSPRPPVRPLNDLEKQKIQKVLQPWQL